MPIILHADPQSRSPESGYIADVRRELLARPPVPAWKVVIDQIIGDYPPSLIDIGTYDTLAEAEEVAARLTTDKYKPTDIVKNVRIIPGTSRWEKAPFGDVKCVFTEN